MPSAADQHFYRGFQADASLALGSQTVTTAGASPAVAAEDIVVAAARLNVTAATGTTPSLTLTLQGSMDGQSNWQPVGQPFPAQGAPGTVTQSFPAPAKFLRWSWTVAGTTPTVTFQVDQTVSERLGGVAF